MAYVEATEVSSETNEGSDFKESEIHVADLKPGPPYICNSLKPREILKIILEITECGLEIGHQSNIVLIY